MITPLNKADYNFNYYHPEESSKYSSRAMPISNKKEKEQWNPYQNNEGTVLGIAGKDFFIAAADTRLSVGYGIISRNTKKIYKLTDDIIFAASGMYADVENFVKYIKIRIDIYRSKNRCEINLQSVAQLISVTLYSRRFFPYYAFIILGGKDDDGVFKCYHYDAVGSYENFPYGSQGSGAKLVVPVLDNVINRRGGYQNLTVDEAKALVMEAMNGCASRDIYTGDGLQMMILKADGSLIEEEHELRHD